MSLIAGTIRGINLKHKSYQGAGTTTRDFMEVWEVTADFGAYTGSTDTATLVAVGAAISARARDGRTRTLAWGGPAMAGGDANNQAVLFGGTAVAALTISSDDFTGQLNALNTVATEITTTSGTTYGVGISVCVFVT